MSAPTPKRKAGAKPSPAPKPKEPRKGTEPKKSTATVLVDLAHGAAVDLFHTPDGVPFATITTDDHRETWSVRSKSFRSWLRGLYFAKERKSPNAQAIEDALATLESQAVFEGGEASVHRRLAELDGCLYLDLVDHDWRVVEITAEGWRILPSARAPVRFRRSPSMEALPVPESARPLDLLRDFLTVDNDGWCLCAAWLLNTLRPGRPFPVLAMYGEQGTGKSTQCRMLRRIVDPNMADLRAFPREERDLVIAALNGWVVGFDNVSRIPDWLSDGLCRISTGAGFGVRQLYTDGDEFLVNVKRPIILNSIEEVAIRGDLVDRTLTVTVPLVSNQKRRTEEDLWRRYETVRPAILGALLDIAAGALAELPSVALERLPRMADTARWVTAAEPSLGWTAGAFVQTYEANQGTAITATLEASLIPTPLRAVLEKLHGRFDGRMSVLLGLLGKEVGDEVRRDSQWPKRPNVFSGELRRLAPAFRQIGIEITIAETGKRRVSIQTEELGKRSDPSGPSGPTPCPDGSDGPGGPDDPGLFGTLSHEGGNGTAGENREHRTVSGLIASLLERELRWDEDEE